MIKVIQISIVKSIVVFRLAVIRNHIADLPFNKDTYIDVFNKADQVFDSNNGSEPVPSRPVSAIAASKPPKPSTTTTTEVAAIQRNQGGQKGKNKNKNQGNNGGQQNKNQGSSNSNQGSSNSSQGSSKKTANDDGLCNMHAKWKENANFCSAPWKCRMKDVWKAPQ